MKMRRIVTAESKSGVLVHSTEVLESASADLATNLWGFDDLPVLPLTAQEALAACQKKGLFGPKGSVRVDVQCLPPETGGQAPELGPLLAKTDLGTGHNMTPHPWGGGMHRTDSIDLALVLSGAPDMAYPDEDGRLREIHLGPGDFIVQNGAFHEWRNRTRQPSVICIITFGTERKTGAPTGPVGSPA